MVKKTEIFGFDLQYDEDAREGLLHLRERLEPSEAKVYFQMARKNLKTKSCEFEDRMGRNFTLWWREGDDYILSRRENR
jgi:hypothetical protein